MKETATASKVFVETIGLIFNSPAIQRGKQAHAGLLGHVIWHKIPKDATGVPGAPGAYRQKNNGFDEREANGSPSASLVESVVLRQQASLPG
jgi:hypothetical protein